MTKEQAKELHGILCEILPPVAKQFNAVHKLKISYDDEGANISIKFTQVAEGQEVSRESVYKAAAIKHGRLFGITPDLLGMKTRDGHELVGLALNRKKYPIVIKDVTGKIRLTTESYIDMLKRQNYITELNPLTNG